MKTRIYLIGMPGSGKSTSGKRFAKKLGWAYADLDKLVVIKAHKSIPKIFEEDGEAAFRNWEQLALRETAQSSGMVVGCGGGTAAWADNMHWMLQHGIVIWLNIHLQELAIRLVKSVNERPLFPDRHPEAIAQQLQLLYEKRQPYFSQAHCEVDSEAALLRLDYELLQSLVDTTKP
jgi:shikimate kinase